MSTEPPQVKNRPNRQLELASQPLENLSFAGCGFLGIYHVGVASCFATYCPQLSMQKISGSSAGALVATAHICGNLELARATSDILRVAIKARAKALGPFHPSFNINEIIYDALSRGLPQDAHVRASGKLHISLTRVSDGENVIIKQFDSRENLIQCLICSCFIPFWSGITPPKLQGIPYIDGGFSDNLLRLDDHTITVSPFSGEADICPQDDTYNLLQIYVANTSFSISPGNLYRISHALLPPPPEILSRLCQQGFDDAMRYLQQTNHISCMRCIAIKSSFAVADDDELSDDSEDPAIDIKDPVYGHVHIHSKCDDCEERRKLASFDGLPEQFAHAIRDTCDQVNKSLYNWIYSHRPIKYLSLAASPCLLPLDLTVHVICKMWQQIPNIRKECLHTIYNLVKFLQSLVIRKQELSKKCKDSNNSARFSCRMDITEYGYPNLPSSVRMHTPPSSVSIKRGPSSSSIESRTSMVSAAPSMVSRYTQHDDHVSSDVDDHSKLSKHDVTDTNACEKAHISFHGIDDLDMLNESSSTVLGGVKDPVPKVRRKTSYPSGVLDHHSYYQYLPENFCHDRFRRKHLSHDNISIHSAPEQPEPINISSLRLRQSPSAARTALQTAQARKIERRKSTSELRCRRPARFVSKMNFRFTLDLQGSSQTKKGAADTSNDKEPTKTPSSSRKQSATGNTEEVNNEDYSKSSQLDSSEEISGAPVIEALCNLNRCEDFQGSESDIIDLANRAICWEKEILDRSGVSSDPVEFDDIVNVTNNQDARVMAYYFLDTKHRLRVTEIYDLQRTSQNK